MDWDVEADGLTAAAGACDRRRQAHSTVFGAALSGFGARRTVSAPADDEGNARPARSRARLHRWMGRSSPSRRPATSIRARSIRSEIAERARKARLHVDGASDCGRAPAGTAHLGRGQPAGLVGGRTRGRGIFTTAPTPSSAMPMRTVARRAFPPAPPAGRRERHPADYTPELRRPRGFAAGLMIAAFVGAKGSTRWSAAIARWRGGWPNG